MQALLTRSIQKLATYKDKYARIYIDNNSNEPYIYVLAFCDIKPQDFQRAAIKVGKNEQGWDSFEQLDKYYFVSAEEVASRIKAAPVESLILLKSRTNEYQVIDSVQHMNEKMYFYAYHGS